VAKISVVINTINEEQALPRALASVRNLADEIVVVDMESIDKTVEIAKKLGAKVFTHQKIGYVEPARNFAISNTVGDWILILDADEEVQPNLIKKFKEIVKNPKADYYRVPRKNIIFGRWIKHTLWWPDYNIRFFRKGFVAWADEIHSVPITQGVGLDLEAKEELSLIHHNYSSISEYLERLTRYTKVQSEELMKNGYVFSWEDLLKKPLNEFLSRFFVGQGYKDGLHGLALSLLQAFSELILYLQIWDKQGFVEKDITKKEFKNEFNKAVHDLNWWIRKEFSWLNFPKFW
jgi:(heptosyl)LPS beta-1,4-glucosyltransferase